MIQIRVAIFLHLDILVAMIDPGLNIGPNPSQLESLPRTVKIRTEGERLFPLWWQSSEAKDLEAADSNTPVEWRKFTCIRKT